MKELHITITNAVGLHARPASLFVQTASKFESEIGVSYEGTSKSAKSILGVLSLGIGANSKITITANGADEEQAINALSELIASNFGE